MSLNEKRRTEINELTNMLRGNLDKVVQHGKRADAEREGRRLDTRSNAATAEVIE